MSEVLTKDTSEERSVAPWDSVISELKQRPRQEKNDVPKIVHYIDEERSTDDAIVALCGSKIIRIRNDKPGVDCVVCNELNLRSR